MRVGEKRKIEREKGKMGEGKNVEKKRKELGQLYHRRENKVQNLR